MVLEGVELVQLDIYDLFLAAAGASFGPSGSFGAGAACTVRPAFFPGFSLGVFSGFSVRGLCLFLDPDMCGWSIGFIS